MQKGIVLPVVLLAAMLYSGKNSLVCPQEGGVVLKSRYLDGQLPADNPDDKAWNEAVPLVIPLSSQVNFKPRIYNATAARLQIRSLNNGSEIAFLLEWKDPTLNLADLRSEEFADKAAIQHPVSLEKEKPWFCMGMPESVVNIWLWNAAWQEDLKTFQGVEAEYPAAGWDYYPFEEEGIFYPGRVDGSLSSGPVRKTPVENLNSARMQTLTPQPAAAQNGIKGKGVWQESRWRVIFSRSMSNEEENDAQFKPSLETGKLRPIAFAVWDGENGERGSQKAVSAFYFLDVASATSSANYAVVLGALVLTLAVEVGLVKIVRPLLRRRKEAAA